MSEDFTLPISRPSGIANQQPKQLEVPQYPTEVVDLPSKGFFYPESSPLASGKVEVRTMTAREEDILTNETLIKKGIVLDKLLESLIVDKSISLDDLLVGDKNAIFYAVRRLAYGDSYGPLSVNCPKCRKESECTINLSELSVKEFDFSNCKRHQNLFQLELPMSKAIIQYALLTGKDESNIDIELKSLQKHNMVGDVTVRFKHMIKSVNGVSDNSSIKRFVDSMPSRDSMAFREHVRKNSPDMNTSFEFKCQHCGREERMAVPMTVQFFWPDASV